MDENKIIKVDSFDSVVMNNFRLELINVQGKLIELEEKIDGLRSLYEQEKSKREILELALEEVKLQSVLRKDITGKEPESSKETDNNLTNNPNGGTVADMLKKTAEEALLNTGYIYDERTKLYYDQSTGYYYDADQGLYYDSKTGTYYRYDSEKSNYVFHSQVDLASLYAQYGHGIKSEVQETATNEQRVLKSRKERRKHSKRSTSRNESVSNATNNTGDAIESISIENTSEDKECILTESSLLEDKSDGECSTTDSSCEEIVDPEPCGEETSSLPVCHEVSPARCIRAMVISSDFLPKGSLHVITYLGITIGSEQTSSSNSLVLPDASISREHCVIYYNDAQQKYFIKDCNSLDGTFLNNCCLLKATEYPLNHGDTLSVGTTQLDLHIHPGLMTCEGCEPGEVQARLLADEKTKTSTSEENTSEREEKLKNNNTKRATKGHIKLFKNFLFSVCENRDPENIEAEKLDKYIAQFILSAKKSTVKDNVSLNDCDMQYEPNTLTAMYSSINRYLEGKSYPKNIKSDQAFRHSRNVLQTKIKELKEMGKGNHPNAAQYFTAEEIKILFEKKLLGSSNPQALLNTVWLNNTLHFGLRGREEHMQLLWGDVALKRTEQGTEYIEFNKRISKPKRGDSQIIRKITPKMFATGADDCPVEIFKIYSRRRPVDSCRHTSRFYLRPISPKSDTWFASQPLGRDALGSLAKKMAAAANISGRKTNFSATKTSIQALGCASVGSTEATLGPRNIKPVNTHSLVSNDQHQSMSDTTMSDITVYVVSVSNDTSCDCENDELLNNDDDLSNCDDFFNPPVVMNTHTKVNSDASKSTKRPDCSTTSSSRYGNLRINLNNYAETSKKLIKRLRMENKNEIKLEPSDSE